MHPFPVLYGLTSGLVLGQVLPFDGFAERWGSMGLLAVLIWWLTQQLSKQVDALRAEIRGLALAVRTMPCDRVAELEKLLKARVADGE